MEEKEPSPIEKDELKKLIKSMIEKSQDSFIFWLMDKIFDFNSKSNDNSHLSISKINLFESQKPFLFKLEDEKWITVVFYFHIQRPIISTFARGLDGKKVGVFASRTPFRPSRLGISEVELIKVEGTTLFVKNFDAFNGSPVLDIKIGSKSLS